jgi:hypothetical protein
VYLPAGQQPGSDESSGGDGCLLRGGTVGFADYYTLGGLFLKKDEKDRRDKKLRYRISVV